jgi:hypothetical protein
VHRNHYDEVAVLCLLDAPAQRIAEAVSAYQASIRSRLNWPDREHTVPIAANIAFMRMLEAGERLIPQQTVAIRLAASLLVRRTGESDELAAAVRATFEALVPARRRTPRVSVDLWVVVAAVLVERGEAPEEFASELERTLRPTRPRMRAPWS